MAVEIYGPHGPIGPPGEDGLLWRGPWVTATAYAKDDAVQRGGSSYIATAAHTAAAATEPGVGVDWATVWQLVAAKGDVGASNLDALTDVDISTTPPTDQQALVFDLASGLWVPGSVAAGGGGASSSAALVTRSTAQTITTGVMTAMSWDAEQYDDNNFWVVGSPTRLTVPAGVTRVRLTGVVGWLGSADAKERLARIHKNGAAPAGMAYMAVPATNDVTIGTVLNIVSPPLVVAPGDYFELMVRHQKGSNTDTTTASWFAMEVLA